MSKKDKIGIVVGVASVILAGAIVAVDYKNSKWNCHNCGANFKAPFSEYFFCRSYTYKKKINLS